MELVDLTVIRNWMIELWNPFSHEYEAVANFFRILSLEFSWHLSYILICFNILANNIDIHFDIVVVIVFFQDGRSDLVKMKFCFEFYLSIIKYKF